MDEIISQLTHDNHLFEEQWSDLFSRIEQVTIPNDSKLVLNALVDYILTEPIDPSPCDVKYIFITMVIQQEISFETSDLINAFIRILDSSRTDQWSLNFLETIYRTFRIGERLSCQTNFIEQILHSLQKKTLIFNSHEENENWQKFLTEQLFSNSTDEKNILNQYNQTHFQEFYK